MAHPGDLRRRLDIDSCPLVYWEFRSHHAVLEDLMYLKAEMLYDNTWALQHWVGGHGGVYMEVPPDYQPSSLLAMQPEHRVVTTSPHLE